MNSHSTGAQVGTNSFIFKPLRTLWYGQKFNSFIFRHFRTLSAKTPGVGVSPSKISPGQLFQLQSPGSARFDANPHALWVQKRQERMGSEVRE